MSMSYFTDIEKIANAYTKMNTQYAKCRSVDESLVMRSNIISDYRNPLKPISRKIQNRYPVMKELADDMMIYDIMELQRNGMDFDSAVKIASKRASKLTSDYDSVRNSKATSLMNMLGYDAVVPSEGFYKGLKVFRLDGDERGRCDVLYSDAVRNANSLSFRRNFALTAAILMNLVQMGCSDYRIMVEKPGGTYAVKFATEFDGNRIMLTRSLESGETTCGKLFSMSGARSLSMASRIPVEVSFENGVEKYACADIRVDNGARSVIIKHLSSWVKNFGSFGRTL